MSDKPTRAPVRVDTALLFVPPARGAGRKPRAFEWSEGGNQRVEKSIEALADVDGERAASTRNASRAGEVQTGASYPLDQNGVSLSLSVRPLTT